MPTGALRPRLLGVGLPRRQALCRVKAPSSRMTGGRSRRRELSDQLVPGMPRFEKAAAERGVPQKMGPIGRRPEWASSQWSKHCARMVEPKDAASVIEARAIQVIGPTPRPRPGSRTAATAALFFWEFPEQFSGFFLLFRDSQPMGTSPMLQRDGTKRNAALGSPSAFGSIDMLDYSIRRWAIADHPSKTTPAERASTGDRATPGSGVRTGTAYAQPTRRASEKN